MNILVCSVCLVVKFMTWVARPKTPQQNQRLESKPESKEEPQSTERMLIQEEIDALDVLVATLSRQEAELLEKAQLTTNPEQRSKLEARAATIHLRLIKLNNKAVRLWDKEAKL